MKNGEYESLEQIDADLSLMFENAKRYNMPNSSIYKRAFRLQQIVQVCVHRLIFKKIVFIYFFNHMSNSLLISLCSLKKENFSGERKKMVTVFCHLMQEASKGKGTHLILNCKTSFLCVTLNGCFMLTLISSFPPFFQPQEKCQKEQNESLICCSDRGSRGGH